MTVFQVAKSGSGGGGTTTTSTLDTIVSDQEMDEPFKERSLMEAILAQKMARAAKFMRSNSAVSIDSTCSGHSTHSDIQAGFLAIFFVVELFYFSILLLNFFYFFLIFIFFLLIFY